MNLFKKTTATVALVTLVSGVFSTGVSAYTAAQLESANALAKDGIINLQSDASGYKLDSTITRGEIAKVAANVANITPLSTCSGKFADVSATVPNTWVCGYVEALLAAGKVSKNEKYNSERNLSKTEALKLMLEAAGHSDLYTDSSKWQEQTVATAVLKGVIDNSFSDYNTSALRGWVFDVAEKARKAKEEDKNDSDDKTSINDLINDLISDDSDKDDSDKDDSDKDDKVVSGDNELEVTLSADTPEKASIPGGISGFPVAVYDFTAGSEDVTVSSITVKRKGLSDKDTITSLAVFTDEGRASKGKNDSQENNTEANLTISGGGFTVKAGETKAVTIVADVNQAAQARGDEFAVELVEVKASSDVELTNEESSTFRVGAVDAPQITIEKDGSVSNPKLGETASDIFKFKIEGANDEDVKLKTITFKSNSNDIEENFENFVLTAGGKEVAKTTMANGKYLTFKLDSELTIREDRTDKFVVKADVIAGAGDEISFYIDKQLDVTAEGTKFGYGASVNIDAVDADEDLGKITIQAGKLALSDVNAPSDKVRAQKKSVILGSIKLRNVAGQNLELQRFGVEIVKTSGSTAQNLQDVLENVEARINGATYELSATTAELAAKTGVFKDTDLNIALPQGDIEIFIEADIKKDVVDGTTFDLKVKNIGQTNGQQFYVVETEDDKVVTDITPSQLSFKKVSVISAGAKASQIPLSNADVVKGAKGVTIAQFEVEAEEASAVKIDEVSVKVLSGATAVTTQQVAKVSLFKGSVSDANLLDEESSIPTDGIVTFNSFEGGAVSIAAKAKQSFVVTIDIVDSDDVVNAKLKAQITDINAEDDDSDDVNVNKGGTVISTGNVVEGGKEVTVKNSGSVQLTADAGNTDNKNVKTILAGNSETVYSIDVQALNEKADVETVTFTLTGTLTNLKKTLTSATLELNGTQIQTNSNSDIDATAGTITFNNLSNLVLPQESAELKLKINTANIGYEKVGETMTDIRVSNVALSDIEGVDSGKDIPAISTPDNGSKTFSIVPSVVTVNNKVTLNTSSAAEIQIFAQAGQNRKDDSNSAPDTQIDKLIFDVAGTSYNNGTVLTLVNIDDSSKSVTGAINTATSKVEFDFSTGTAGFDRIISNGGNETYRITVPAENDKTLSLRLIRKGVEYTVESSSVTTNLKNDVDFGSRKY